MSVKLAKYQDSRKYLSKTWFKDLNTVLISIGITVGGRCPSDQEDPVLGGPQEDSVLGGHLEDPVLGGHQEDPVLGGHQEDPVLEGRQTLGQKPELHLEAPGRGGEL